MTSLLIALVLQSSLALLSRQAMENPASVSTVPPKIQKDYEKLWMRFLSAKEDARLVKDLDNLLKKQKSFDPALTIEGYIFLYKGDDGAARQKFEQAFALNSNNRIALYYLAELAYAHNEYARASDLYTQLLVLDSTRPDIQTKRERALLLATDDLLRSAARAQAENRLSEAEQLYRQALKLAPKEPVLHLQLADLLAKENKKDEAEAERKTADELTPHRAGKARAADESKPDDLEDLGRWGRDIDIFHQIKNADAITREQLAALVVRYFPQVTELRQTPQIATDIQDSWARLEIQTVVGVGIIDTLPNHTFEPGISITRADLAVALARLGRLLSVPPVSTAPIEAPDLAPANAQYAEFEEVLTSGVLTLEDSGNFNAAGAVSGRDAIRAAERLFRKVR